MRGGRASARGFKNHAPPARLVAPWKQALHARRSRAELRTYFYPHPFRPSGMTTLEGRGLSKSIDGHPVLKDVTFGLQDGELAAILGPSGGGKTTLFRCILGELTPEAGEIFIDGQEGGQLPTERPGIGGVYPSLAPFPHLPRADNIGDGFWAPRGPAGTPQQRAPL